MKIIQIVVVEDYEIRGLGDDGQLYSLNARYMPFGAYEWFWTLFTGKKSLSEQVAAQARNFSADASTFKTQVEILANRVGAQGKTSQSSERDALIFDLAVGDDFVQIVRYEKSVVISANDNSTVTLTVKANRYV